MSVAAANSGGWSDRDDLHPADGPSRRPDFPLLIGTHEQHNLVRWAGRLFAIPQALGPIDLQSPWEVDRPEILVADDESELRARVERSAQALPIEYAGWLPAFKAFGNCGAHPQFAHTADPPTGYRFVRNEPRPSSLGLPWKRRWRNAARRGLARARAGLAAARLAVSCVAAGADLGPVGKFLWSRHVPSQMLLPAQADMVFLTSVPYTWGQYPWLIEIEDVISLFFPFVHNGQTADLDIHGSPYWRIVRALLEADHCRAIVTHMASTARCLPRLFESQTIAKKTFHVPLGVPLPSEQVNQTRRDYLDLLFSNSWHQDPRSFYLRGGLDVLEAFDQLQSRYSRLRLTLRTRLPDDLAPRYRAMIERGCVRVLDSFLPKEEWDALRKGAHIFLLPSDRVHVVSVLQAMAYGSAVVVSDGWGMEEYVANGRNGLVVPGRYGRVTWIDDQIGMLRENYRMMDRSDPQVVQGLVRALERLVRDEGLRRSLGAAARRDVANTFNLANWNTGLQQVLDRCHPRRSAS